MTTRHFCTLFDHNYLTRGLALHESLVNNVPNFHLYILAMSNEAYNILSELKLKNVELISLQDFEDEDLLKIKPSRTQTEYCWTVTPSLPLYCIKLNPDLDTINYIDADCYFFNSPEPIFEEMGKNSVLVIEHRFSPDKQDAEKTSGRFNVGLVCFRNDDIGIEVLQWWRKKCNEWCFFRFEDGKLGDQLYLNQWPQIFQRIHILKNIAAGVAPWNIWNYSFSSSNGKPMINKTPVIFFHFHKFKMHNDNTFIPAQDHDYSKSQLEAIYKPYSEALARSYRRIYTYDQNFSFGTHKTTPIPPPIHPGLKKIKIWKRQLKLLFNRLREGLY